MNRGRCKSWVEFQRRAPGKDRAGNPNGAWQKLAGSFAEVQDSLGAFSGMMAQQQQDTATIRVLVPWDPLLSKVTAEDRILLQDGRVLDIAGTPLGVEGKDMLTYLCEVHASDAVNV